MRRLETLLTCAVLCTACASTTPPDLVDLREGIAPRYEPSFQAVQGALDDRDTPSADAILGRLRNQLVRESSVGTGDVAAEAKAALDLASGFQRIIDGRQRLDALDMWLEFAPEAEADSGRELELVVTSRWNADLELTPGPANLILARTQVDQAGRQATMTRALTLDPLNLRVEAGESVRHSLGAYPSRVTGDALAERLVFRLEVRSGEIREGEDPLPAQRYTVAPLEYVGLAPFLPTGAVEPAELANYLQRPEPASAPIMERTIRILPARRAEALQLLKPLVSRGTDIEFQRLAPALHWLAPEGPGVSGREQWLRWLEAQSTE